MHECELNNPGKMSAVIGASIDKIQTICDSVDCQIANINSDSQIVISAQHFDPVHPIWTKFGMNILLDPSNKPAQEFLIYRKIQDGRRRSKC